MLAITSVVLGAVLVLSLAAAFALNALNATHDTSHRALTAMAIVGDRVRRQGVAGLHDPTVHTAILQLHGGVRLYDASGRLLGSQGLGPPHKDVRLALADWDKPVHQDKILRAKVLGGVRLVVVRPVYVLTTPRQRLLAVVVAPIVPEVPGWREIVPVIVAIALSLGLAQLLWSLLIRRFTRPIEALTGWAGRLADGELRARVPATHGVSELTGLTLALQRMADALASESERREAFLAEVAHDLRTPLSVQRTLLLSMAREDPTSLAQVPRLAGQAQAETERLIRLVNGLLQMARLEAGQQVTVREQIDLREPVAMAAAGFEVAARRRRVRLVMEMGERPVPVVGDADRIAEITANLLDNAMRHAGADGEVAVVTRQCADGRHAELEVRDSGPGVSEAVRQTMWQRFASAGVAGGRPAGGLGLAISRALARAMGGDLDLAPGMPTRFVLTLPCPPRRTRTQLAQV